MRRLSVTLGCLFSPSRRAYDWKSGVEAREREEDYATVDWNRIR